MPNSIENFKNQARLLGPAKDVEVSGLGENFRAGLAFTVMNNLSWSKVFWTNEFENRRKQIAQMVESGRLTHSQLEPFAREGDLDYNKLAKSLQENEGLHDVLTDDEIRERIGMEERNLLSPAQDVMDRADAMGQLSNMAGSMAGYILDPVTLASLFIPIGSAARGATMLARGAYRAGQTSLTEGALEMIRQPLIYNWRTDLGRDYILKEGLAEVALVTTGAGVIGGAAELAKAIRIFRNKKGLLNGDLEKMSKTELEELEVLLDKAIDPDQNALDHLQRVREEIDRLNGIDVPPPPDKPPTVKVEDIPDPKVLQEIEATKAQIEKVKQTPDSPNRKVHLQELERELAELEGQTQAKGSARAEPYPDELADAEVYVEGIGEDGSTLIDKKSVKQAIDDINTENQQLAKTWDCLTNGS